jgi:hypothetical protein
MPAYSSLVGTLLLGNTYREQHPAPMQIDGNLPLIEILKQKTLDLFTEQPGTLQKDQEINQTENNISE